MNPILKAVTENVEVVVSRWQFASDLGLADPGFELQTPIHEARALTAYSLFT